MACVRLGTSSAAVRPCTLNVVRRAHSAICGPAPASRKARSCGCSAAADDEKALVGEDAAIFSLDSQTSQQWTRFLGVLGTVLAVLISLILFTDIFDDFVATMEGIFVEPQYAMVGILAVFALCHSGLAALRPYGEEVIGPRAWRVLFGTVSLPLAVLAVFYFINHRYSGTALWDIRSVPHAHDAIWVANFVSFLFLYPSTFNLLEVAAVDKPKLHLWETGVMRITRHPQLTGQLVWCFAHTAWIGNSFMVWTSLALCVHHLFGSWHGDQRLRNKYGAAFDEVAARTSVVPFAAILDGRQKLPADYWKEWARPPYLAVVAFTVGTYYLHPVLQLAAYKLNW